MRNKIPNLKNSLKATIGFKTSLSKLAENYKLDIINEQDIQEEQMEIIVKKIKELKDHCKQYQVKHN